MSVAGNFTSRPEELQQSHHLLRHHKSADADQLTD